MYKLESFEHARKASSLFWRGASAQAGIAGLPVATPLHQHQEWHVRLGGLSNRCLVYKLPHCYFRHPRYAFPACGYLSGITRVPLGLCHQQRMRVAQGITLSPTLYRDCAGATIPCLPPLQSHLKSLLSGDYGPYVFRGLQWSEGGRYDRPSICQNPRHSYFVTRIVFTFQNVLPR